MWYFFKSFIKKFKKFKKFLLYLNIVEKNETNSILANIYVIVCSQADIR